MSFRVLIFAVVAVSVAVLITRSGGEQATTLDRTLGSPVETTRL